MAKSDYMVCSVTKREEKTYFFNGNNLVEADLDKLPRNSKVALTSGDRDFISYNFDVEKDLSGDSLDESVEIKMYQESGLNPMLEYKIVYHCSESKVDATKLNVQAFAITNNTIEKNTQYLLDKFGYIDLILPTTTLPTALYNNNTLEKKDDIFLYFVKDSLYLSIFHDGELVYGKTIDTGLSRLTEDFIRTTGEQISYDDLILNLVAKGIDEDNYSLEDKRFAIDFKDLLTNIVSNLNSVLQYVMRLFSINSFARVFVGTKHGTIPGGAKLFEELLGVEGHDYIFYSKYFLKDDDYVDQRDILLLIELENRENKEIKNNPYNVTIYERPSSFIKRKGGKFLVVTSVASFLLFLLPVIPYLQATLLDLDAMAKLSELKLNQKEFNEFKAKEKRLTGERVALNTKLQKSKESFKLKQKLLNEVYNKKINKKRVVLFINKIFDEINQAKLKVTNITLKENVFTISLEGKRQKQITALVKTLIEKKNIVRMESISFEGGNYKSTIKVNLK